MASYQLAIGGVIYTPTVTFIAEDPASRRWQEYQAWLGSGGIPDPADTETVEEARVRALSVLSSQAAEELSAHVPSRPQDVWLESAMHEQALAAIADGAPDPGDFPLIDARVPERGADALAVANWVATTRTSALTAVAAIEDERSRVRKAIADASTPGEVDTALATLSWPA